MLWPMSVLGFYELNMPHLFNIDSNHLTNELNLCITVYDTRILVHASVGPI